MKQVEKLVDSILRVEGSEYTNDPDDLGGPTKYGITLRTLTRHRGEPCEAADVEALTEKEAREIYRQRYYYEPGFAAVAAVSESVAHELTDTGVNCGTEVASTFLQRSLNVLNNAGKIYPDIVQDGEVGPRTISALQDFMAYRGSEGEAVLVKLLNCLQGARYLALCEAWQRNEKYLYGWLLQRVE